jgi:hypothetical protein
MQFKSKVEEIRNKALTADAAYKLSLFILIGMPITTVGARQSAAARAAREDVMRHLVLVPSFGGFMLPSRVFFSLRPFVFLFVLRLVRDDIPNVPPSDDPFASDGVRRARSHAPPKYDLCVLVARAHVPRAPNATSLRAHRVHDAHRRPHAARVW